MSIVIDSLILYPSVYSLSLNFEEKFNNLLKESDFFSLNVVKGKFSSELATKNVYSPHLKFKSIFWGGVPISIVISKSFWSISSGYSFSCLVDFLKGYIIYDWNDFLKQKE